MALGCLSIWSDFAADCVNRGYRTIRIGRLWGGDGSRSIGRPATFPLEPWCGRALTSGHPQHPRLEPTLPAAASLVGGATTPQAVRRPLPKPSLGDKSSAWARPPVRARRTALGTGSQPKQSNRRPPPPLLTWQRAVPPPR